MIIYLKILEALKNSWPFLKRNYKTISFIVVTVLMFYFWWSSNHQRHRAEEAEAGRDAAIKISNGLSSEVRRYKNKQGDSVLVTKVIGIPKSQVDALLNERDLQWLKKFDGLKKNGSNLRSAETFDVSFKDDVIKHDTVKLPCKNDSIKAKKFQYKDSWNDIEALVIGEPKLQIKDHYYAVVYLKRPKGWFFKFQWSKREATAEITNSNKLIRIDSLSEIYIK